MASLRHPRSAKLLAVVLALAGCADSTTPTATAPPAQTIVAENVAFEPTSLVWPAGQPVHVVFENRDDGVPHGLALSTRTSGIQPTELWSIEITEGPDRRELDVAPLTIGPYLLFCPVHPNMQIVVDVT
jgi:plastocyanin